MTEVKKTGESKRQNIIACPFCEGSGIKEIETLTCYHRNDYDYHNILCPSCDGQGRLLEIEYFVNITYTIGTSPVNKYETFKKTEHEKLKGRKTSDIYVVKDQ